MAYKFVQGIIQKYTGPRTCNVLQVPQNYLIKDARLTLTIQNQTKPLPGSVVMVASEDSFKSYVTTVLREPLNFINDDGFVRGSKDGEELDLSVGEVFLESRGDPSAPRPGLGSTFFLGNDGTASLYSGQRTEFLLIGGSDDDDDHEVVLTGTNGFFESNINDSNLLVPGVVPGVTGVQSTFRFDEDNNMQIGNNLVTAGLVPVEVVINELTFEPLGNIKLRNAIAGVDNGVLEIKTTGDITLKNVLSSMNFNPLGAISISSSLSTDISATTSISLSSITSTELSASTTMSLSSIAGMTLSGSTINLNNGTLGVARLTDSVATTSTIITDPAWWTFWTTLATLIAALPTVPLDGGATLKAGLSALFATIPLSIAATGTITSASSTVKAGI